MLGFPADNNFGCQAAAYHKKTGVLADQNHPAVTGETIELNATGLGRTSPLAPEGSLVPKTPQFVLAESLTVYIGSMTSKVDAAALKPGTIGTYIADIVVPAGLTQPEAQSACK